MCRSRRGRTRSQGEEDSPGGCMRRRTGMLARWPSLNLRALATFGTADAIATGVAAAGSVAASLILLPDMRGVAGAGLALLMVAIAAIDARRFIIPDELSAV